MEFTSFKNWLLEQGMMGQQDDDVTPPDVSNAVRNAVRTNMSARDALKTAVSNKLTTGKVKPDDVANLAKMADKLNAVKKPGMPVPGQSM
jgi:hypothetical protein